MRRQHGSDHGGVKPWKAQWEEHKEHSRRGGAKQAEGNAQSLHGRVQWAEHSGQSLMGRLEGAKELSWHRAQNNGG